jgi:hypothetical protein
MSPAIQALIAERAANRGAISKLMTDNHLLTEAITRLLTGEAEAIVEARLAHGLTHGRAA